MEGLFCFTPLLLFADTDPAVENGGAEGLKSGGGAEKSGRGAKRGFGLAGLGLGDKIG
jgi:hypothetical protein